MEGVPVNKVEKIEVAVESSEMSESVEKAREFHDQLQEFHDTDVVGSEALAKVEAIAHLLSIELQGIPAVMCLQEGLPYHPSDVKSA